MYIYIYINKYQSINVCTYVFLMHSSIVASLFQVWVLTGDKQETAVNISYSAGHFKRDMIALELTKQQTTEACLAVIQDLSNK